MPNFFIFLDKILVQGNTLIKLFTPLILIRYPSFCGIESVGLNTIHEALYLGFITNNLVDVLN